MWWWHIKAWLSLVLDQTHVGSLTMNNSNFPVLQIFTPRPELHYMDPPPIIVGQCDLKTINSITRSIKGVCWPLSPSLSPSAAATDSLLLSSLLSCCLLNEADFTKLDWTKEQPGSSDLHDWITDCSKPKPAATSLPSWIGNVTGHSII